MLIPRRTFLATTGALAVGGLTHPAFAEKADEVPQLMAKGSVNPFAASLYGHLKSNKGNVFASPYSVWTALSMTATGAQGETQKQMAKTLCTQWMAAARLPTDGFGALLSAVNGKPGEKRGFELSVANGIWAQQGYPWREQFKDSVARFKADLKDVNFAGAAEATRQQINRWVETQTNDKIKDLFAQGVIDNLTRMVLVNAIYFKGDWEFAFDKKATQDAPFTMADGTKQDVPLMFRKARVKLAETDELQMVELPYKGQQTSLLVLLPRKVDGLPALEDKLNTDWSKWTDAVKPVGEVQVHLPRFKVEAQFTLNDTLKAMGMVDAFDFAKADFGGMVSSMPEGPLAITAVVHKAYCDVNEEGTEAAAATGVAIGVKSAMPAEPKVFRADHPFLFAIRHNPSNAILFLGRLNSPKG